MGLAIALNNALAGLNVNQQQLSVLSQNIANANTPGYSRQIANQQALYLDGQGEGVTLEDITRQIDQYLVQSVRDQGSTVGQTGAVNSYNTNIQQLLGQPGNNNSLTTYITNFFNSAQALAQTPGNAALQQSVINGAVTLSTQINQLAQGLQGLQFQADQDINTAITSINSDLKQLSQINNAITSATALGQSVVGMQDQRDTLLNDVAQYLPIQTYSKDDGSINVTTSGGITLLDTSAYQLQYSPAGSPETFAQNGNLFPITISRVDAGGNPVGSPIQLVSGGTVSQVSSLLTNGKLAGLIQMRDQQLPDILGQLDSFTASLRSQINAIQNSGTGFPGTSSYTGDRLVNAADYSQWGGSVRIAVLGANGQAVGSPYADEPNGLQPLTLDLSSLNTGHGAGYPSVQGIINAINNYYGVPQNKAEVGNINNIQMVSNSSTVPGNPAQINFGFNLNNISALPSNVFVTNVQVTDSNNAAVTTVAAPTAQVALAATNTYLTAAGSSVVTIKTQGANTLTNGQEIYLSDPGQAVNGIPEANMTGYFTVSNVTANSFQITVANGVTASADGAVSVSGQTATPPYASVAAGQTSFAGGNPSITASLTGNTTSPYYNVTATVTVDNGNGSPQTAQVTYRVNSQSGLAGSQFGAIAVAGEGKLVRPTTTQPIATASLVDANGNQLPVINGQYITSQDGYLQIKTANGVSTVAIDSLDSAQLGLPNTTPPTPGSNLGFSGYFGLNDFFTPNQLTSTGDTVAGSAQNLQVQQRLQANPGLLALGTLTQSPPAAGSSVPNYSYEIDAGNNSVINQLAQLGEASVSFAAGGGLSASQQSFSAYAAQIIGGASENAANAQTANANAKSMLDGYTKQASSISGVNLDTELANTVIYQNAYAASARIITVTNTLFDSLLQAFS